MDLLTGTTCPRCKKGRLEDGKCLECNAWCDLHPHRDIIWWYDVCEPQWVELEEWARENGRVWCEESGEWVVEAIEPPKGAITRMEERIEVVEAVVELAMNPVEVVRDGLLDFFKGTLFGWLRRKDKSTYRP